MKTVFTENKKKYIGVLGAFGLSVGTSIGWGSFVVTSSDYLSKAGLLGSIIGILLGCALMAVIAYCYHCMMNKVPDSGGIYSFVKHAFDGDHAFLASWFLIIVYASISEIFHNSPIYRIGGDEFVVLLEGRDYEKRPELLEKVVALSKNNAKTEEGIVIAAMLGTRSRGDLPRRLP